MTAQKLYKAAWEYDAEGNRDHTRVDWDSETRSPHGWREYALSTWPEYCGCYAPGEIFGGCFSECFKPFFWPNTDKVFRSRSAAQYRVDIINRWGGRAVLVECTPDWVPVEVANRRRANARMAARVQKKRAELMALEAQMQVLVENTSGRLEPILSGTQFDQLVARH